MGRGHAEPQRARHRAHRHSSLLCTLSPMDRRILHRDPCFFLEGVLSTPWALLVVVKVQAGSPGKSVLELSHRGRRQLFITL